MAQTYTCTCCTYAYPHTHISRIPAPLLQPNDTHNHINSWLHPQPDLSDLTFITALIKDLPANGDIDTKPHHNTSAVLPSGSDRHRQRTNTHTNTRPRFHAKGVASP